MAGHGASASTSRRSSPAIRTAGRSICLGPGHGIQLRNQASPERNGRLVLSFWHRREVTAENRAYGVSLLCSDDHGDTWREAGTPGATLNMNESRIAELADGTLVLNSRGQACPPLDTSHQRIRTLSADGGESFGKPEICPGFEYCACDAGMVRVGDDVLLMSSLAHPEKRRDLKLYRSTDRGLHWEEAALIHEGPAQYSDLAIVDENTVAVLYGKGTLGCQPVALRLVGLDSVL